MVTVTFGISRYRIVVATDTTKETTFEIRWESIELFIRDSDKCGIAKFVPSCGRS
jgi:hypothetical protein